MVKGLSTQGMTVDKPTSCLKNDPNPAVHKIGR